MKDRRLQGAAFLLLGAFTFALYNWTYGYVLIMECGTAGAFFLFDGRFLADYLRQPGGLMLYAGRFFTQFYHYTWLGALVIAALVVCCGWLLNRALDRLNGEASLFYAVLPCILIATAFNSVIIHVTVGLIASTAPFLIYLYLPKGTARRLYALLAIPAVYLLAGISFWLFVVWLITWEWLDGPPTNLLWKLLCPALAISLPLIAWLWLFPVRLHTAFLGPIVFSPNFSIPAALVCAWLVLMPLWGKFSSRLRPASPEGLKRIASAAVALLALLAAALPVVCYDADWSERAAYHQLYKQRKWDDILAKAAAAPSPDLMVQFFTNCALAHEHRLLDEMFHFPQLGGARGLIFNWPQAVQHDPAQNDIDMAMYNSDIFFEMGHVNAAFMHAFDQMVLRGRTYENMQRMAECSMVNGNYEVAVKYLTLLERTLFHREYARHYKALLADTKAADEVFAEARSRLPTVELPMSLANFVPMLSLVKSDPHNRLAFDYLIAWCLLDGPPSLTIAAENIGGLKDAGYVSVPVHLEEAMLAWNGRMISPPGFEYDAKTLRRFSAFEQKLARVSDRSVAQRELGFGFAGSYMYYDLFERPPRAAGPYGRLAWRLGNEFRSQSRFAEAVAFYRLAIKVNPELVEAHVGLADVLTDQGNIADAAVHYAEARRLRQGGVKPAAGATPETVSRTE